MFQKLLETRALWERPLVDLWSIPHLLAGVLIVLLALVRKVRLRTAFAVSVVGATVWELFEHVTGLSDPEHLSNQISDIIFTQLGFLIAAFLFRARAEKHILKRALYTAGAIFIAMVILGWLAYRHYITQV